MDISILLARVIGLFVVISTLAILMRYKHFVLIEKEAAKNLVLVHLSGFSILILGILLVVNHNIWVLDWRGIITIISWMVLLKGILRGFYPELVMKIINKKAHNKLFILAEVFVFLIGLYLIYKGFFNLPVD